MDPAPHLDPTALERLRRLGGDKFACEMIGLFLDYVGKKVVEVRGAQAAGDLAAVQKAAHPVKSSAGNVGAVQVQALAARIEAQAKEGESAAVAAGIAELEQAFAAASLELEAARQVVAMTPQAPTQP